jgi:hypothetical protein
MNLKCLLPLPFSSSFEVSSRLESCALSVWVQSDRDIEKLDISNYTAKSGEKIIMHNGAKFEKSFFILLDAGLGLYIWWISQLLLACIRFEIIC